ncbi:Fic family protein [Pedobacter frigiditerrae]|uniref:Fic family protein n=1 Tax=Pedobacter frigiditerrae TaxID=2530452 RepID=UPI00292D9AE1|nr:Fic family protein [Pedobacter frigiditerrae]
MDKIEALDLQILPTTLLSDYLNQLNEDLENKFNKLKNSELDVANFSFYTSVSAVFSSKIEGEDIELDSYIKHKRLGAHFLPDYTRKIDDLYDTYVYAQQTSLNQSSVKKAHILLTKHILQKPQQGKLRKGNMFVVTKDGKIEYVAVSPEKVEEELVKFFEDIEKLIQIELTFNETIFFASLIHLVFVKIHPFEDGNGRTGRLLEKWFLSEKLGEKAWLIPSERNYYEQHQAYYNNLRKLGIEYEELDYTKALPFLLMLQSSI